MKRILSLFGLLTVLAVLILAIPFPAEAQTGESPIPISLQEAIARALEKNPQLLAEQAGRDASNERITQAKSAMLPQAYFTQSFQRTTNPMWALGAKLNQEKITIQDFSPERLNDPDASDTFTSRLWVTWPLFDSGRSWFGHGQAKLDSRAIEASLERTRQEVIFSTAEAYSDLLLSRQSIDVIEYALKTARTHLKMIEDRYDNGLVVKSDVLRAKVHTAELDQDLVTARSRAAVARAALNTVMGDQSDLVIIPADKLEKGKIPDITLPEWIEKALSKRPDLLQLSLNEETAKIEVKKSRAGHWPSIEVMGSYEFYSEDFDDTAESYTIGANATINLFSWHRISARTRESIDRLQGVRAMRQAMRQKVRLETEKAFYDLASADSRILSAMLSVEMAQEALRIIKDRYDSGLVAVDSLLNAELALYRANNNHCHALRDHIQARGRLHLAAGTLSKDFH